MSTAQGSAVSNKSTKGFLRRITAATAWGEGLDGYDLGSISVVLPIITIEFGLSATVVGLVGASTLAGIFFGGPIFGYLTDRFGRRRIFLFDLVAFVIFGLAQAVVTTAWQLLVLWLLLGLAIGARILHRAADARGILSEQGSWSSAVQSSGLLVCRLPGGGPGGLWDGGVGG